MKFAISWEFYLRHARSPQLHSDWHCTSIQLYLVTVAVNLLSETTTSQTLSESSSAQRQQRKYKKKALTFAPFHLLRLGHFSWHPQLFFIFRKVGSWRQQPQTFPAAKSEASPANKALEAWSEGGRIASSAREETRSHFIMWHLLPTSTICTL